MKDMKKAYFFAGDDYKGKCLTSSSANFIANMAKEWSAAEQDKLNRISFLNADICLIGGQKSPVQIGMSESDFDHLSDMAAKLVQAHGLQAWLREAIKAKEVELERIDRLTKSQMLNEFGIKLPAQPELIREDRPSIKDVDGYAEVTAAIDDLKKVEPILYSEKSSKDETASHEYFKYSYEDLLKDGLISEDQFNAVREEFPSWENSSYYGEILTRELILEEMSMVDHLRMLDLETEVAVYGKFIHKNGPFNNARLELLNSEHNPIEKQGSGTQTTLTSYYPSVQRDKVDDMFFSLQKLHRSRQAELNGMNSNIDSMIEDSRLAKKAEYDEAYLKYQSLKSEAEEVYEMTNLPIQAEWDSAHRGWSSKMFELESRLREIKVKYDELVHQWADRDFETRQNHAIAMKSHKDAVAKCYADAEAKRKDLARTVSRAKIVIPHKYEEIYDLLSKSAQ